MPVISDLNVFALGLAFGVLGLILLFSLAIAYAYDEPTLLFLAAYLVVMVALLYAAGRLPVGGDVPSRLLLVAGPALIACLQVWLLRKRTSGTHDIVAISLVGVGTLGLLLFYAVNGTVAAVPGREAGAGQHSYFYAYVGWVTLLVCSYIYLGLRCWDTAGPWKWWLLLGQVAGLAVAMFYLADISAVRQFHWPVILMLVLQAPPVYLSLVWRSRLLNELRLRSAAANVTDPLTGLVTTSVLIERLMRIMARVQPVKSSHERNALFLIEVQNWNGLLRELGTDFGEKLLLEAALRLRRSVGDNDMVARISGGRFAVVAQALASPDEVTALATRLVVSGLRIDSPSLPGVELRFRVIVTTLKLSTPLALQAAQAWLTDIVDRFSAWPPTHRARSILVVQHRADTADRLEAASSY